MAYKMVFRLKIRYVCSMTLYPVEMVRQIGVRSKSYGFIPELHTKLLRLGLTYLEVDGYLNPSKQKSSAIRPRVLLSEALDFFRLVYLIHFGQRAKYSNRPTRVIPTLEFTPVPPKSSDSLDGDGEQVGSESSVGDHKA